MSLGRGCTGQSLGPKCMEGRHPEPLSNLGAQLPVNPHCLWGLQSQAGFAVPAEGRDKTALFPAAPSDPRQRPFPWAVSTASARERLPSPLGADPAGLLDNDGILPLPAVGDNGPPGVTASRGTSESTWSIPHPPDALLPQPTSLTTNWTVSVTATVGQALGSRRSQIRGTSELRGLTDTPLGQGFPTARSQPSDSGKVRGRVPACLQ